MIAYHTKAKFVSADETDFFTYGYTEYWDTLTSKEKADFLSRGINRDNITLNDLSMNEMESFTEDGMIYSVVKKNGFDYLRVSSDESSLIKVVMYMWIEKGKTIALAGMTVDGSDVLDSVVSSIRR